MIFLKDTIKIIGRSVGDRSVGIPPIEFEIDTGLLELTPNDREFIIKNIIRDMWELHDNGPLKYEFSDEWDKLSDDDKWDYRRIMNYKESEAILCPK